jgi:hypothetical protein
MVISIKMTGTEMMTTRGLQYGSLDPNMGTQRDIPYWKAIFQYGYGPILGPIWVKTPILDCRLLPYWDKIDNTPILENYTVLTLVVSNMG